MYQIIKRPVKHRSALLKSTQDLERILHIKKTDPNRLLNVINTLFNLINRLINEIIDYQETSKTQIYWVKNYSKPGENWVREENKHKSIIK